MTLHFPLSLILLSFSFSGCGVLYTVANSEAKLDRLSIAMSKEEVQEAIGKPDMVLREYAGITVWQYSMTTRKQWLYELSLCPVSVFLGGCVFYPFTNSVADYNREHHVHVILVKDELCAWGRPLVLLKQQRSCGTAVLQANGEGGFDDSQENALAVITGSGPMSEEDMGQYRSWAVVKFEDAPNTPGSGARVAAIVTTLLLDLGLTLVERAEIQEVMLEQALQLQHSEDGNALSVGKLAGAKAVVLGEVARWDVSEADRTAQVSLSLRVIDVETGQLLFGGSGHLTQPMTGAADDLARVLVHRILSRFAVRAGLLGTGRVGVKWTLREHNGGRAYVVEKIQRASPADKAGLKEGDVVVACNGSSLVTVKSEIEARRLCQIDAGQILSLEVQRAHQRVVIRATAEPRPDI